MIDFMIPYNLIIINRLLKIRTTFSFKIEATKYQMNSFPLGKKECFRKDYKMIPRENLISQYRIIIMDLNRRKYE